MNCRRAPARLDNRRRTTPELVGHPDTVMRRVTPAPGRPFLLAQSAIMSGCQNAEQVVRHAAVDGAHLEQRAADGGDGRCSVSQLWVVLLNTGR